MVAVKLGGVLGKNGHSCRRWPCSCQIGKEGGHGIDEWDLGKWREGASLSTAPGLFYSTEYSRYSCYSILSAGTLHAQYSTRKHRGLFHMIGHPGNGRASPIPFDSRTIVCNPS